MFAKHLPGSIVVSEHTVTTRSAAGSAVLKRQVHVVIGDVYIKVTVTRGGSRQHTGRDRVFAHRGYVVHYGFVGYYPPSNAQLHALANDPRLISARS